MEKRWAMLIRLSQWWNNEETTGKGHKVPIRQRGIFRAVLSVPSVLFIPKLEKVQKKKTAHNQTADQDEPEE